MSTFRDDDNWDSCDDDDGDDDGGDDDDDGDDDIVKIGKYPSTSWFGRVCQLYHLKVFPVWFDTIEIFFWGGLIQLRSFLGGLIQLRSLFQVHCPTVPN